MIRRLPTLVALMAVVAWATAAGADEEADLARAADLEPLIEQAFGEGDLATARAHTEEALELRLRHLGPDHILVGEAHNNLGTVLLVLGEFQAALPHLEESLRIHEAVKGPNDPAVGILLSNLAGLLADMGDFPAARPLYERAILLKEQALGPDHPSLAVTLAGYSWLLYKMGDLDTAIVHARRSLDIRRAALGSNSPRVGQAMTNLGSMLRDAGELDAADDLMTESLAVREAALPGTHPDLAAALHQLALVRMDLGREEEALDLLRRALSIREEGLADAHPDTARCLADIGACHYQLGDATQAAASTLHALEMLQQIFGSDHPDTAATAVKLGLLLWDQGDVEGARERVDEGLQGMERTLEPLLYATSERERIRLIQTYRGVLDAHLSLFVDPADARCAYEAVLRWKGVVAVSLAGQRAALLDGQQPETVALFHDLSAVRRDLAEAQIGRPDPGEEARRLERIGELSAEKERLERELCAASAAFAAGRGYLDAELDEVISALPDGSAVVDYWRYRKRGQTEIDEGASKEPVYVAFVLRAGNSEVVRVDLGPAAKIEAAVTTYREAVAEAMDHHAATMAVDIPTRGGRGARKLRRQRAEVLTSLTESVDRRASEVRRLLWDPLSATLDGFPSVYVVPDAAVTGVSFAGLPAMDPGGGYLLEHRAISYLGTAKEIAAGARFPAAAGHGSLVIGGVDYDGSGTTPAQEGFSRAAGCNLTRQWSALAKTLPEAQAVATLLAEEGDGDAVLLSGDEATEDRVLAEAPGRSVVHLATHGFFAGGECVSALSSQGAAATGDVLGLNPMVLSGLVLAGANAPDGSSGADGILTAEEVASLDLRGVDLTVLSACETGLGDIRDGEGVLGLRRAFAQAGSRSLVMSLWEVPDAETQTLMERFYTARVTGGAGKMEALQDAQLAVLAQQRTQGDACPYLWASFILAGER